MPGNKKMTSFSKHICMDLVVIQVKISQLFERSKFKWKFPFEAIVGKTPGEAMSANEETNKMKENEIAKMVSKNGIQKSTSTPTGSKQCTLQFNFVLNVRKNHSR